MMGTYRTMMFAPYYFRRLWYRLRYNSITMRYDIWMAQRFWTREAILYPETCCREMLPRGRAMHAFLRERSQ